MGNVIYLCTIGTGTAGKLSNVAEGVSKAIRVKKPWRTCLIPSASEYSLAVADIVREGIEPDYSFFDHYVISNFDDLLQTRNELTKLVVDLKKRYPDSTIALNPTSGTKQMTAAAIVVGIELNIEDVEFISGPRLDGVVVTGKESISRMNGRVIMADFSTKNARDMMKAGAFYGAALILKEYKDINPVLYALSLTLHHWNRFAYQKAIVECAAHPELAESRKSLMTLVEKESLSLERAADMLNFVERSLGWGDVEEGLAVLYRVVELMGKLEIKTRFGITENSSVDDYVSCFEISKTFKEQLERQMSKNGRILLGLTVTYELLRSSRNIDFPLLDAVYKNNKAWKTLQKRNFTRYGHDNQFVAKKEVEELFRIVTYSARAKWPCLETLQKQFEFPSF